MRALDMIKAGLIGLTQGQEQLRHLIALEEAEMRVRAVCRDGQVSYVTALCPADDGTGARAAALNNVARLLAAGFEPDWVRDHWHIPPEWKRLYGA